LKAIVTGASRGIGKGIASSLAKQGFEIHVTGRKKLALGVRVVGYYVLVL